MPDHKTADGRFSERQPTPTRRRGEAGATAPVTGSPVEATLALFRRTEERQESAS